MEESVGGYHEGLTMDIVWIWIVNTTNVIFSERLMKETFSERLH